MVRQQLFIGAALLAGVAIGYVLAPREAPAVRPAKTETPRGKAPIAEADASVRISELRARVRALEAKLAAAASAKDGEARGDAVREQPQPRGPWARMEELRRTDPERFAQMTNRFAEMRMRRARQHAERARFLSSVDTSGWSATARETHETLLELMERRESLEREFHQAGLDDDRRRALGDELRALGQQIRELNASERQTLMSEVARGVGLEPAVADDLTEVVRDIYEATGDGFGPRGRGGRAQERR